MALFRGQHYGVATSDSSRSPFAALARRLGPAMETARSLRWGRTKLDLNRLQSQGGENDESHTGTFG
jgi:hypothetical protein